MNSILLTPAASLALIGDPGSGRQNALRLFIINHPEIEFVSINIRESSSGEAVDSIMATSLAIEKVLYNLGKGQKSFFVINNLEWFLFPSRDRSGVEFRAIDPLLSLIRQGKDIPTIFIGSQSTIDDLNEHYGHYSLCIEVLEMQTPPDDDFIRGLSAKSCGLKVALEAIEAAIQIAKARKPKSVWGDAYNIIGRTASFVLNDKPIGPDPVGKLRQRKRMNELVIQSLEQDLESYQRTSAASEINSITKRIEETRAAQKEPIEEISSRIDKVSDAKNRLQYLRAELRNFMEGNPISDRATEQIRLEISDCENLIPKFGEKKILKAKHVQELCLRLKY